VGPGDGDVVETAARDDVMAKSAAVAGVTSSPNCASA
jgi:hypothetical protein